MAMTDFERVKELIGLIRARDPGNGEIHCTVCRGAVWYEIDVNPDDGRRLFRMKCTTVKCLANILGDDFLCLDDLED